MTWFLVVQPNFAARVTLFSFLVFYFYLGVANFMALMLTVAFMTMATGRLQTILEQRSTHDPLTGVLKRRGFALFYDHQRLQMRRAVCDTLRESDDVARFGGEEFIVLLPDADQYNAVLAAERIRHTLRRCPGVQLPRVTVSIGIGCHASDEEALDALLARTDAALYRAK